MHRQIIIGIYLFLFSITSVAAAQGTLTPAPCPLDYAGYLAPRLRVGSIGQVAGDAVTRLRDAPSLSGTQIDRVDSYVGFSVIGGPVCADGYVWWQLNVYGSQVGWMAEGESSGGYFLEPLSTVTPSPTATIAPTHTLAPTTAPADLPEIAAITDGAIRLYDLGDDGTARVVAEVPPVPGDYDYEWVHDLVWSTDGQYLAFTLVRFDYEARTNEQAIYVTTARGDAPALVTRESYGNYPIYFTQDNTIMHAGLTNVDDPDPMKTRLVAWESRFELSNWTSYMGSFAISEGCGGGSDSAVYHRYSSEIGYNERSAVLLVTPYGVVYTANCLNSGIEVRDPLSGEVTPLGTNLSRVKLAPDGNRLAGSEDVQRSGSDEGTLVIYDFRTETITPISTSVSPEQVAWRDEETIYFSTSDGDQVSVYRINADGTGETLLFTGAGSHVARLLPAPDGSLFFGVIPTDEAWNAARESGEVTGSPDVDVMLRYVPVALYRLMPDGEVIAYGGDFGQVAINAAAFAGS